MKRNTKMAIGVLLILIILSFGSGCLQNTPASGVCLSTANQGAAHIDNGLVDALCGTPAPTPVPQCTNNTCPVVTP